MTDTDFGPDWSAARARAPEAQLREWLDFALAACDAADEIARRALPPRPRSRAQARSIVRDRRRPDDRARDPGRILARWPDHGLVGEEYGGGGERVATRWFIDPIDGTHNFIRGVPLFGTLLAVEHDGEMQVGVISAPAMRERWYAYRGGGAWAVGPRDGTRRIRVSRVAASRTRSWSTASAARTSRAA